MSGPGKVHFLQPGFTVNGRTIPARTSCGRDPEQVRVALFVLVALLTVSCEGPIGPTGPQGSGVHKGQGVHRGPKERRASRLTGVRLLIVRISRLACLV